MNIRLSRALLLSASLAVGIAHAYDDTEIYLGSNLGVQEVLPNVLFIVDTSGSMDTEVPGSSEYDPGTTYPDKGWGTNRVYVSGVGNLPNANDWFYASVNYCDAAVQAFKKYGYYPSGTLVMYNNSSSNITKRSWVVPKSLGSTTRSYPLECGADYGTHGKVEGDGWVYPTSRTSTGWSSTVTSNTVNFSWGIGNRALYSSNYLNYLASGGSGDLSRIRVVKKTLKALLDSVTGINAAIMRFDHNSPYHEGGNFATPMLRLDNTKADYATNKQTLIDALDALDNPSWTPTAETLYEAGLYFQGKAPHFGAGDNVSGVVVDGKYNSPIDYECQKNFIVFLSDGDPTQDGSADALINSQPDFLTLSSACSFVSSDGMHDVTGDCAEELALYLHKKDLSPEPGHQGITTYTIGFKDGMSEFGQKLMEKTASNGGGFYRPSTTVADIVTAFNEIIIDIQSVNSTFTAPAVSVNAFNRLTHMDELYFALFKPEDRPQWNGNIKRYKLTGSPATITDLNGVAAIDPDTGFFKSTAVSFWALDSADTDGDDVTLGGAAARMPTSRKVYTYLGSSNDLTAASNALTTANITPAMLGVATATEAANLLQWAKGVDVDDDDNDGSNTDIRAHMGDPLHTEPLLITYGKNEDGTADLTLFASTNDGFLHAIDTDTGVEEFAFIPKELLANLKLLYDNQAAVIHPVGLDGPLSAWIQDKDYDGIIESGDHVYLYVAMRKGGRNVYALDVTDRTAPTIKWVIEGGTGDFVELGQTWSKPTLAKVKLGGVDRMVLIFGGGYDTAQDSNTTAQDDTVGRAIYMVDAETGARLGWIGQTASGADLELSQMTNSIPSDVRVIDSDGDGFADLMYVGDMRGQLWRFDINKDNSGIEDFATGGVIADLGGATAEENRRFYYPPSVSLSSTFEYFNIAIGSGWREHPLDTTIHDMFFVIRDRNVSGPATNNGSPVYEALVLDDLYDTTENLVQSSTSSIASAARAILNSKGGYYINLNEPDGSWIGEKVLAQALTLNNVIYFTTFTPAATAASACQPSQGIAKLYMISAENGGAAFDLNGDGVLERGDRSQVLVRSGIPPRPTAIFTQNGTTIVVGTEATGAKTGLSRNPSKGKWWTEND